MRKLRKLSGVFLTTSMAAAQVGCGTFMQPGPMAKAPVPGSSEWNVPSSREKHRVAYQTPQSARVNKIGDQMLQTNRIAAPQVVFLVPETDVPEVFHKGENMIVITSGLVDQCRTDGQLAAILSYELGEMIAETESQQRVFDAHAEVVGQPGRAMRREPPPEVRIGRDGGSFGEADQLRKAELVQLGYEKRPWADNELPPNSEEVARDILKRSGWAVQELDAAQPLLAMANKNSGLEKQFLGRQ